MPAVKQRSPVRTSAAVGCVGDGWAVTTFCGARDCFWLTVVLSSLRYEEEVGGEGGGSEEASSVALP